MNVDDEVVDRLTELTQRLRATTDERRAEIDRQRQRLLEANDLRSHVREENEGVLVLYPEGWSDVGGTVDPSRVSGPDEAVEIPLDASGDEKDWEAIEEHNHQIASAVKARYGPVHGATASALATYLSNHHLRRIEDATESELAVFREDYFVRNAWPDAEQQALLERSVAFTLQVARCHSVGEDRVPDGCH